MKRTLSLILSICMLISLLPTTVLFAGATETDAVNYNFHIDGHNDVVSTAALVPLESASGEKYFTSYGTDRNWAYLGSHITGAASSSTTAVVAAFAYLQTSRQAANNWIAFKIRVPKTATYSISGTASHQKYGSEALEMYIAPLEGKLAETFASGDTYGTVSSSVRTGGLAFGDLGISSESLVGTAMIKQSTAATKAMTIKSAKDVTLSAEKEYVLVFNQGKAGQTRTLSVASLTLTPRVLVKTSKEQIKKNEVATLSSVVKDASGTVVDAEVTYTTEDNGIISIDGNSVTGIGEGTATITATAVVEGVELTGSATITVIDESIHTVDVSLDGGNRIPAYATRRVKLTFRDRNGTVITEFETQPSVRVWFECGNDIVDGIEDNSEWYITVPAGVDGIKLCAEAAYNGKTVTGSTDIEIVNTDNDKHVIIDFMNQPITDVYAATLEEHGWRFVSWDLTSKGTINLNLNGLTVTPRRTGKGVLEVKIPRSGYYSISISGKGNGIKAAEDVDIYLDGVYAGDFCFYNKGTSNNILPETFRTFYIEEGTHTLTFDCQTRTLQVFNPVTGEMEYVNNTYYGQAYGSIAFFAAESIPEIKALTPMKESYEINKGESVALSASILFKNGVSHEIMPSLTGVGQDYAIVYELSDGGEYIDLAADGTVTAKELGTAHVKMTLTDNTGESKGQSWSETVEVNVRDYSELAGIEITGDSFVMRPGERESIILGIKAVSLGGYDFAGDISWDSIEWNYDAEQTNVSFEEGENGTFTAEIGSDAEEGVYTVSVTTTLDDVPYEASATITVTHGKAGRTYYTDERIAIARENIKKYTWAKNEKDAAVEKADKYVALGMEGIWNLLAGEGIPRSIQLSRRGDEISTYVCRYCGVKVAESGYPWITSPLTRPWKIQCPECKRLFPSNDFGSFYELGLGNDGVFDRALALLRHHNMIYHKADFAENHDFECDCEKLEMVDPTGTTAFFDQYGTELTNWYKYYGYGQGYLKNDMYTDLYTEGKEFNGIDPFRYNADLDSDGKADHKIYNLVGGYDEVKSGMLWCVDDGWGYAPGCAWETSDAISDLWPFIPYYNHCGFWHAGANAIIEAIDSLKLAYVYTGEEKYGKIGAVLIDRLADLYPEYSANEWKNSNGETVNWNVLRYAFSSSSHNSGKISNDIWDANFAISFSTAYDAFWPMYDDPEVQSFLAEKEREYYGIAVHQVTGEARLPKNSNKNIRDNIERDLIYEIYSAAMAGDVNGNFGMHQAAVANAAVVYDREPYSREMIDWLFVESKQNTSTAGKTFNTGGELLYKIVNQVSRDGQGTESSSSYNYGWIEDTVAVATTLGLYKGELTEKENLWRNPKYITMLTCYNDMIDLHRGTQSIGDQGMMGTYRVMPSDTNIIAESYKQLAIYTAELEESLKTVDEAVRAELEEKISGYQKTKTQLAQLLYEIAVKGKNFALEDLHYDIFTKNPDSLYSDIEKEIDAFGEYNYDRSSMMTGYGFASLRAGALYNNVLGTSTIKDTTRDFWMYFGGATSHMHRDFLNIGIDAYGISMSSDNGYPERTGAYPSRHQWTNVTLSHNTVVINETSSVKPEDPAKPLHFDNKDTRVRLMDVDGSTTYQTADDYRRTVMMIDYDDEISYGVDFFKVLGGEDHIYSFHASSNTVAETTGLDSIEHQVDENGNYIGTYAGTDARFGNDPWTNTSNQYVPLKYPSGYTWLEKIRKDNDPDMNFSVDYKISDMRKLSRNNSSLMDIHLKVTTANDWKADEVTLAQSVPTRKDDWDKVINRIEYLLVRRKAKADEKLDTLYTTVFEPYNKTPYIKNIDRIEMVPVNGENLGADKAAAVRVELIDGRVDYVMYATRKDITYTIADTTVGTDTEGYSFLFCGFAGVWTVKSVDGKLENIYSYLHDGTLIGNEDNEQTDALTGKVTWHTKGLSIVNKAQVEFDEPISKALLKMMNDEKTSLSGRIFVGETDSPGNAAFIIEDAEISEDGKTAILSFGNVTFVDSYDSYEDDTYNYIINEGTRFAIPMSYEEDNAPEFDEPGNITSSAGSSLKLTVRAESQVEDGIVTYSARTLPRGASFSAETATFTWKPDGSQVGESLVAIDATDSLGRTSTLYFTVTVYGSTTGGSSQDKTDTTETPEAGNTDTPAAGGGGGGGGGAAPDDKPHDTTGDTTDTDENGNEDAATQPNVGFSGSDEPKFTDLGNHAWAADAINALAADGIIKGMTASTFNPESNITRADFALLLVRAFKLSSDNTENFADVMVNDYYASELAIARNNGIIGGIGDNKFAPRNSITRQDMMVIVYRALQILNVGFGIYDEPQNEDFATIAPYAKEAVSALVGSGIVNGKSGLIAPTDYTTRAEVAVLLKRILDYVAGKS